MSTKSSLFPLRWVLPAVQLVICALAIWPFRLEMMVHLLLFNQVHHPAPRTVVRPRGANAPVPNIQIDLEPKPETEARADRTLKQIRGIPAALNIPSTLVQMPYAIWGPTHEYWTPRGMDRDAWQNLTFPVIGIFFWWIAGRGLEALAAARKRELVPSMSWIEVVIGSLTFLLGLLVFLAFITERTNAGPPPWQVMSIGGAIWTVLGAATVSARIAQWRIRRRSARDAAKAAREDQRTGHPEVSEFQ